MKIRNTLLLAVLLLFVNKVQAKGASLNSLIEELAPIARLTNGIAIETELSADANKMNDVVAEFLQVGSGDDVAKLKELRVDEVAKELGELYATVEKVPELNVDMAALADTFKALELMKQGSAVLENMNLTDPSAALKDSVSRMNSKDGDDFYKTGNFKLIADKLQFLKNNQLITVGDVWLSHIKPLKDAVEQVKKQLNLFIDYKTELRRLIDLQNISSQLADVAGISNIVEQYSNNFATFSTMDQKLGDLNTEIRGLSSVSERKSSLGSLANSLDEISSVMNRIQNSPSAIRLTAGFPNKFTDLKLMLQELKAEKFKKLIAKGKSFGELSKSLTILSKFHEKFESVDNIWQKLSIKNLQLTSDQIAKNLKDVLTNVQTTPDFDKLSVSLVDLQGCFQNLALPAALPDFKLANKLFHYADKLGPQIEEFIKFFEEFKGDHATLFSSVESVENMLNPWKADSPLLVYAGVHEKLQNNTDADGVGKSMKTIIERFQRFQSENPLITIEESVDWTVVPVVIESLNGTNLDSMLGCVQKKAKNSKDIDTALSLGKSFQVMKSEKIVFNLTQTFLVELTSVKKELLKLEQVTKSALKPKSRRRQAPNQKSLANLKNAQSIATDLGKGVQVLREFAKILENEASVQVAVDADDGLKNAISAIPGVQSVWTDENRNGMGKMVVDLKELDKFAGRMTVESIKSFGKIFEEAGKVRGVEIDAKLFDDPISKALFSNFDWNIYPYHQTFHSLKDLQLNFTQHHEHLKAASLTLDPLQKFFDDFFEIDRSVKEEEGLSTVTLVIIICGSSVGVILLVLLVKFLVGRWQGRRD